ncbi:MAG: methyltransferase [Planctomycetaceae bacterium]|nr:methyltransferase [Planctomycetaceae bacterium]
MTSPRDELNRLLAGFWTTQAIYVAVRLRIPDLLASGPRTAEELAAEIGAHERSMYRLLRALSSSEVFREDVEHRFALTPLSECLRRDIPGSLSSLAWMRGDWQYQAWGDLLHNVQTGETAFDHVFGESLFEFLRHTPENAAIFDQGMVGVHGRETDAMLAAFDFSDIRVLADIGGGNGSVLVAVLAKNPSLNAILFDRADVVDRAKANLVQAGVAERVQFIAGDFFQSVPNGADAYFLRHIIHDWGDQRATTILKNCRAAMPTDGRLLLAEFVLPDGPEPFHGKWFDLAMMVVTGGQERTETEYRRLLDTCGFTWRRVVPTASELSVIEATQSR